MRLRASLAAVLALSVALPALAQQADAPATPPIQFRGNAEWIGAVYLVDPSEGVVNPGNRTLGIAQTTWLADLRFDLRAEQGSRWMLVVRPRLKGSIATTHADSMPSARNETGELEITEAFLTMNPKGRVSLTYGLQNFQWGPAELMSPSNRIFHDIGLFRDPLYVPRGRNIARVNVSAGRQWSLVGLAELDDTDETPFRAGEEFGVAGQVKLEYTSLSGAAYAGITAGSREGDPFWAGGYASAMLNDTLSAYCDVSLQDGSQAWYPAPDTNGVMRFEQNRGSEGNNTLALAGVRYTWSEAFDARLELLHQDAGYSRAEIGDAALAVIQRPSQTTIEQWLRPGLEFLGKDLAFASVTSRDLPPGDRLDVQARYLHSLTDGSGAVFVTASFEAGDALVLFGSVTLTHGSDSTEFTRLADGALSAGLIWSW